MAGEQDTEAAQAGETYLEARLGNVVVAFRQECFGPLYAQPGQKLVRGFPIGLLVETQEVVGREVRPGRDVR